MFSCSYDTVQLTNSLGQKITDQLSGSMARFDVTVEGRTTQLLYIKFTSDSSVTERGFLAQYNITTAQPLSISKLSVIFWLLTIHFFHPVVRTVKCQYRVIAAVLARVLNFT